MLDKRVDFQQTDVRLGLFSEFEHYEQGRILYEKRDKIPQIAIFEGHFQPLRKPVSVKQYVCASLSNLNTCIKEAQMQIKVESLYIHKLLDITIRGNGSPFKAELIMERLERDLEGDVNERFEQQNPYTEEELLQILVEVLDALIFAKLQGVAYRNIKPRHIIIENCHYRLTNFGSALETTDEENLPDGTAEYLSPEMRLRMLGKDVEAEAYQSDVYSLGVTMLHLAKLRLPYLIPKAWGSARELVEAVEET